MNVPSVVKFLVHIPDVSKIALSFSSSWYDISDGTAAAEQLMLITSPRHALLSVADVSSCTLSGGSEEKQLNLHAVHYWLDCPNHNFTNCCLSNEDENKRWLSSTPTLYIRIYFPSIIKIWCRVLYEVIHICHDIQAVASSGQLASCISWFFPPNDRKPQKEFKIIKHDRTT